MSRQLIGRTLVRLYPAEVRRARGNELVGTLLDAGDVSTLAFLANAASLARSGLWARAREELGRPVGQLLVGAFCWAAVLMAMSDVVEGVGTGLFWGGSIFSFGNDPETVIDMYVLPVLILALFTTGRNRTTGLLGNDRPARTPAGGDAPPSISADLVGRLPDPVSHPSARVRAARDPTAQHRTCRPIPLADPNSHVGVLLANAARSTLRDRQDDAGHRGARVPASRTVARARNRDRLAAAGSWLPHLPRRRRLPALDR